jgi:predicted aminopeptidase
MRVHWLAAQEGVLRMLHATAKRRILDWLALGGLLLLLAGCEIGYLARQGYYQVRLLAQRRPVEEVLADPSVEASIKEKIWLVQRVRTFGESQLGLRPSKSYQSYIEVQGKAVAYMVSASLKDRLEPYLWSFPLVGRFPYKGFFHLDDAREEAEELRSNGYDIHLSTATAFSALGWFSDPLYSPMLGMDELDLIYTILHEMVHASAFFPNHVDFNEQLATFVGWRGTLAFLEAERGAGSSEAQLARRAIQDERLISQFLSWAHETLSSLYALPLSPGEKMSRREEIFREIRGRAAALVPQLATRRFSGLEAFSWNNASLLALWRYRYDVGPLDALSERTAGDLKALVNLVHSWRDRDLDPARALGEVTAPRPGRGAP